MNVDSVYTKCSSQLSPALMAWRLLLLRQLDLPPRSTLAQYPCLLDYLNVTRPPQLYAVILPPCSAVQPKHTRHLSASSSLLRPSPLILAFPMSVSSSFPSPTQSSQSWELCKDAANLQNILIFSQEGKCFIYICSFSIHLQIFMNLYNSMHLRPQCFNLYQIYFLADDVYSYMI